jgi:hypothetical protein
MTVTLPIVTTQYVLQDYAAKSPYGTAASHFTGHMYFQGATSHLLLFKSRYLYQ